MGGSVGINYTIRQPAKVRRIVTIGGIGTNIFTAGPSEGIRLLQEFTENPTRQRLVDWLHSMVYDPPLVTDELIEERWELATNPSTLESARRMYGKAAFGQMMAAMRASDGPMPWASGTDSVPLIGTARHDGIGRRQTGTHHGRTGSRQDDGDRRPIARAGGRSRAARSAA
jgi:pimeloyl-ACP methyl ester carboxylesterase